jgi:DNA-binding transcriptional LysR family regulator
MARRPPPLQWLPAFEASARLLSFSKAAQELHITTSAVSQQIKQLESHLGLSLFRRLTRRIELTDEGQAYAQLVSDVLQRYRQGHERLMQGLARPMLRISMTPLVAHEIILPALGQFQAQHPDTDLHIDASMGLVDFESQSVDAALRYGDGHWAGVESLPLSRCRGTIVASPALLRRLPVTCVQDLSAHTLIHQRADQVEWNELVSATVGGRVPRKADLVLDSNLAALRAAEQGLGVAVAVLPLVQPWLDDGRLVALCPPLALPMGDHFVFRANDPRRVQLTAVYHWIKALFDELERRMPSAYDTSVDALGMRLG